MIRLNKKKLCESCFAEINAEPCPVCGYDSRNVYSDPAVLPCGSILMGRYIIGMVIGRGGFGITYTAYDKNTEKKIAIKEFFPNGLASRLSENPTVVVSTSKDADVFQKGAEKFYNEASLVSRFNGNPGIVSVYDFFYENDTVYFSMEYLSGKSLKAYLDQNGALSAEQAVFIADKISSALLAAHSINVLHRDISPDNIMLCDDGSVKLIDFGAARQVIAEGSQNLSVIVKQGFAPLEQYQKNGSQGPWTDIYSLGATLYYALTLDTVSDPMSRLEDDELFLSNSHGICNELWEIIKKATQIRASDRYADVFTFRKAIAQIGIASKPIPISASQPAPIKFTEIRTAQPLTAHTSALRTDEALTVNFKNKKKVTAVVCAAAVLTVGITAVSIALGRGNSDIEDAAVDYDDAAQTVTCETTAVETTISKKHSETNATTKTSTATTKTSKTTTAEKILEPTETKKSETTKPPVTTVNTTSAKPPQSAVTASPVTTANTTSTRPPQTAEKSKSIKIGGKEISLDATSVDLMGLNLKDSDISELKKLKNLTYVNLSNNNLTDISVLGNIPTLTGFAASDNNIKDISFIKNLPKLDNIVMNNNKIKDISAFSKLTAIKKIWLCDNYITDISPIAGNKGLTEVGFNNCADPATQIGISDISALKGMKKLKHLCLQNTGIEDISPLSSCPSLEELALAQNWITDYSPLTSLKNLKTVYLDGNPKMTYGIIETFEGLHFSNNAQMYLRDMDMTEDMANYLCDEMCTYGTNASVDFWY